MSSRARSQQLAQGSVCHYTQPDVYTPVSLSLPIPTAATSGPNTSPPPCFSVWVGGYCPFFSFWGTKHPIAPIFFEFWIQGCFGLTLLITTTAVAEGGVGFATLTKYLATNVRSPPKQGHTATGSTFFSLGPGLLPIF